MWILPEVTKLVDGISEHGVGRWTEIKRQLFSTSAYRTPIDLRVFYNAFHNKAVVFKLEILLTIHDCRTNGEIS